MTESILEASSPEEYDAFRALTRGYVEWCRKRFSDLPWFVDRVFSHQSLDDELSTIARAYGRPRGKVLLAAANGQIIGGGAYRTIAPGVCEMKRLFVPEAFQGTGVGRRLCEALVAHARADGFHLMRLDTATLLHEALRLYRSAGFVECEPYNEYPQELRPFIVFMERPLSPTAG